MKTSVSISALILALLISLSAAPSFAQGQVGLSKLRGGLRSGTNGRWGQRKLPESECSLSPTVPSDGDAATAEESGETEVRVKHNPFGRQISRESEGKEESENEPVESTTDSLPTSAIGSGAFRDLPDDEEDATVNEEEAKNNTWWSGLVGFISEALGAGGKSHQRRKWAF